MTVTLITGASKGIGYETARSPLELGHTVYVGARDTQRGTAAARELGAEFLELDVTDDASVAAAIKHLGRAENRLDVLVNNAGIYQTGVGAAKLTGADALQEFDTNVVGVVRVTQAAAAPISQSRSRRPWQRAGMDRSGRSPIPTEMNQTCR